MREYGRLLRRGWLLISVCVALGLAIAAAVTLTSQSEYRAQTTVFVSVSTAENQSSAEVGASFTSAEARVASYVALVDSSSVLEPVISQLGLDMSVDDLADEVTAEALPNTVIMSIDVVDERAERAAEIADAVATSLSEYVAQIEAPSTGGPSRVDVTVLESAAVPNSPLSPDLIVYLVLGGATGLIVGVGIIVLRSLGDARIRSAKDLVSGTTLHVLESIPYDAKARKTPLVVEADPRGVAAEAFRMLRTTILFGSDIKGRTLLVTSARAGDGKSSVVANLAQSIANVGRTVVVVDADLRSPMQSALFGLSDEGPSLVELLQVGATAAPARLPVTENGVAVLRAGQSPASPGDLIGSETMERVLADLAARYDHVLVDSPAILSATDAVLLGSIVSGTVLVAGVGVSTTPDIVAAADRLRDVGGTLVGVVVSRAAVNASSPVAETSIAN